MLPSGLLDSAARFGRGVPVVGAGTVAADDQISSCDNNALAPLRSEVAESGKGPFRSMSPLAPDESRAFILTHPRHATPTPRWQARARRARVKVVLRTGYVSVLPDCSYAGRFDRTYVRMIANLRVIANFGKRATPFVRCVLQCPPASA